MPDREYPNPTPSEPSPNDAPARLAAALAGGARAAMPALAGAVTLAVCVHAALTVARLAAALGADLAAQALAAMSSVGVLLALAGVLVLARSASLRALAAIYAGVWLPLTLALVGAQAALASELAAVPAALADAGRTLAALLAGLALLPVVTLAVASRRQDDGDMRAALAHYLANVQKLILLSATAGAGVAFGVRRGVPVEVTAFVAVTLEAAFILALTRSHEHRLHAGALVVFGCAIGALAVETLATLSGLATLPELAAVGERVYLLTPALAIAYVVAGVLAERPRTRAAAIPQELPLQAEELPRRNGHIELAKEVGAAPNPKRQRRQ